MDNYNYPMGADTPDAPWNQSDPDPVDVEVCVSITLSKSVTISVTDYQAEEWEDWEKDDEGGTIHTGGVDYDFSDSDLKGAYESTEYTIPDLLKELQQRVQKEYDQVEEEMKAQTSLSRAQKRPYEVKLNKLQNLISACDDWNVDELEVVEE